VGGQSKRARIASSLALLAAGCLAARAQSDVSAQPRTSAGAISRMDISIVERYDQEQSSGAGHGWQGFFNAVGLNGAGVAADGPDGLSLEEPNPDHNGLSQGLFPNGGSRLTPDSSWGTVNRLQNGINPSGRYYGDSPSDIFFAGNLYGLVSRGENGGPSPWEDLSALYVFKDAGNSSDDDLIGVPAPDDNFITARAQGGGAGQRIDDSIPLEENSPNGSYGDILPTPAEEENRSPASTGIAPANHASRSALEEIADDSSSLKIADADEVGIAGPGNAPVPLVLSPEPSSMALICLGAAALLMKRRK
jgi:hypothetical protein